MDPEPSDKTNNALSELHHGVYLLPSFSVITPYLPDSPCDEVNSTWAAVFF